MRQDEDLKSLDEMIAGFGRLHDRASCDLVLEHLHSARRSLLGAMLGEYSFNLDQAREAAGFIPDKSARAAVQKTLLSLFDSNESKQRRSSAAGTDYGLQNPVPAAPGL